jgi:urease accessory protein
MRIAMITITRMTTTMVTCTAQAAATGITTITMTSIAQLTALLHLASPALPVGAFSYSQGLEAAVDVRHVQDEASAARWIAEGLDVLAACEAPLWLLQFADWQDGRFDAVAERDAWFLATRETRELRLETAQMGWSLNRLIQQMGWGDEALRAALAARAAVTFPTAFAAAAAALNVDPHDGVTAYCFAWVENQMAAAVKAVPLGQAAGQRILFGLHAPVARSVEEATRRAACHPPELSTFSPGLGVLSARHETQYSRLFRS